MTVSSSSRGARLGRLFGEFFVIVVGVMAALVAESWWSERDDRRYEAELRGDMLEEFRTNLETLEGDLELNRQADVRISGIAGMSEAELLAEPDSFFHGLAEVATSWAAFDPMMGTAQALVRSGNLGPIADPDLRLRLSNWAGLLDEKTRYTDQASTFAIQLVWPAAGRMAADLQWTASERRELRQLFTVLSILQRLVMDNQLRLQDSAEALVEYLSR